MVRARQGKLPSWVRENVPNDAVQGETCVVARKTAPGETGAGTRGISASRRGWPLREISARQNFEPGGELRAQLIALAAAMPEESRRLVRKGQ